MKPWLFAYGAALLAVAALDGLWLGFIAKDFYRREMGALMAEPVRVVPAALFYFAYPAGLIALAMAPAPGSLASSMLRAALVGLVAYGTYDLSNLAVLKGYSTQLALTDMAWGTFLSALAGGAAHLAWQRA